MVPAGLAGARQSAYHSSGSGVMAFVLSGVGLVLGAPAGVSWAPGTSKRSREYEKPFGQFLHHGTQDSFEHQTRTVGLCTLCPFGLVWPDKRPIVITQPIAISR